MDAQTFPVRQYGGNRVVLTGSFRPNGSSHPSATHHKGKWFTVTRTGTGTYAVVLNDTVVDVEAVFVHLRLATAADKEAQAGTYTTATRTLVISIWDKGDGSVSGDVASDADNVISMEIVVRVGSDV